MEQRPVKRRVSVSGVLKHLGASGSGKSTFLNIISGLERPDSGKVFYDGIDITALSDDKLTTFRKENIRFIF